jgi:hypothetical protein
LKTNLAAHKTKVSAMTIHFNLCKLIKAKKEKHIFSHFHSSQKNHSAKRSLQPYLVDNPGRGLLRFLPKLEGGSVLIEQNCQEGFLILVFFSFLLIIFLKICLRGLLCYTPPHLPVCILVAAENAIERKRKKVNCLLALPPPSITASFSLCTMALSR